MNSVLNKLGAVAMITILYSACDGAGQPLEPDAAVEDGAVVDQGSTAGCGNGVVDPGETCDRAIVPAKPGTCPTTCDDANACTTDTLVEGGSCKATCTHVATSACTGGDGCCPKGCTSKNDSDCSASCGNGIVDALEKCDTAIATGKPGACPTSCNDGNACTSDSLLYAGSCSAICYNIAVVNCINGDGCCPAGCTAISDTDCSPHCGNGIVEPPESCDTAIGSGNPGACPDAASCDDNNPCTSDLLLNGGTCGATCSHTTVTTCKGGDGCCPAGCTALSDSDCSASCGNGQLDPQEQCDTAIAAGKPGACPTSCDDGNSCTVDTLLNGGTCSATCTHASIGTCKGGDGCCPTGCTAVNDSDCSPSCGNGTVEPPEKCDTAIAAGKAGACPTSCSDGQSCTADTLLNAGTCSASCSFTPITTCKSGDGCCPTGCTAVNDSDCSPSCGNGTVEPPELCDKAIAAGKPGACPTSCSDGQGCTTDTLLNAGTCSASCSFTPIGACIGGDGCCPTGCTSASDSDCGGPIAGTCAGAAPLALVGGKAHVSGSTKGLADEFPTLKCSSYGTMVDGPQAYYKLTLDSSKIYRFSVTAAFNSYFYIFSGAASCVPAVMQQDCTSAVTGHLKYFSAYQTGDLFFQPGKSGTYVLAVDSIDLAQAGAYALDIEELPAPTNGTCATAQTVTLGAGKTVIRGTTAETADEFATLTCGTYSKLVGPQVYYKLYLSSSTTYRLRFAPQFSSYLFLFLSSVGCSETAIEASCSSKGTTGDTLYAGSDGARTLYFKPSQSGTYTLAVDSTYSGSFGAFTVEVDAYMPDATGSTCAGAQTLPLVGGQASASGDTYGLANEFGTSIKCAEYSMSGPQKYYRANLTAGMLYEIGIDAGFDGWLYVASPAAGCNAASIDADCGSGGATGNRLRFYHKTKNLAFVPATSGYHLIAVDTSGTSKGNSGAYTLTIHERAIPTFSAPFTWTFENDCKGLATSGDWECGPLAFLGNSLCWGSSTMPPLGGHSGSWAWGTTLNGCHALGDYAGTNCTNTYPEENAVLTFRVTIPASWTSATLTFWSWDDYQLPYETAEVRVDGVPLLQNCTGTRPTTLSWVQRTVNLSSYVGKTVRVSFHFVEDAAVQYSGWYIDDVGVSGK